MRYEQVLESAEYIRSVTAQQPTLGIILGSGLGGLVDVIEDKTVIPYGEIEKVAAVMTCGLIPNGLNLWMEDGELLRFAIWHRKKIAAFLREKAGI